MKILDDGVDLNARVIRRQDHWKIAVLGQHGESLLLFDLQKNFLYDTIKIHFYYP